MKPPFRALFSFSRAEVERAFAQAQLRRSTLGIRVLIGPSDTQATHGKLLVIASRRVGHAPARNLLRRRIRAIYYEQQLYRPASTAIIILYPQAKEKTYAQIKDFLCTTFADWHTQTDT